MLIGAAAIIIALIGVVSVISLPNVAWAVRWAAILFNVIVAWFALFRVAAARIYVQQGGVKIVNPLRSVFVPWDAIDRFTLRPWGLIWTPIGHAELRDGSSIHIIGIAAPNPAHWPAYRSAHRAIAELNEELEARRAGYSPS